MKPGLRNPARRRPLLGLTLIELITVLVVLGVLIALVAPSMRSAMARHRVEGVNAGLVTDLQLARSELTQRAGSQVALTFGSSGDLTCYTLHTVAAGASCDCTQPPGAACTPPGTVQEIKSVQLQRAMGVTLAASSPGGTQLVFSPPQGLAAPDDLVIDVQDATSGHLRTRINGLGRPTVCSPDGSIRGVSAC